MRGTSSPAQSSISRRPDSALPSSSSSARMSRQGSGTSSIPDCCSIAVLVLYADRPVSRELFPEAGDEVGSLPVIWSAFDGEPFPCEFIKSFPWDRIAVQKKRAWARVDVFPAVKEVRDDKSFWLRLHVDAPTASIDAPALHPLAVALGE